VKADLFIAEYVEKYIRGVYGFNKCSCNQSLFDKNHPKKASKKKKKFQ